MDLYISQQILFWFLIAYLSLGIFISSARIFFWHYVIIKKRYAAKYKTIGSLPLIMHPVIFLLWPRKYINGYATDFDEEGGLLSCLPLVPYEANFYYFCNASRINDAIIQGRTEYLSKKELTFNYERDFKKFNSKKFFKRQINFALIFILINPILWIIWFPVSLIEYVSLLRPMLSGSETIELLDNEACNED